MAVFRINLYDPAAVADLAGVFDDLGERRAAREVRRIRERYGPSAELTDPEAEAAVANASLVAHPEARAEVDRLAGALGPAREWDAARRERAYAAAERARERLQGVSAGLPGRERDL